MAEKALNYAAQYAQELAQAYPYALNFGDLYNTENNGRYQMGERGNTVYIPAISTTGRTDGDRDSVSVATRNYSNEWEPKVLEHHRMWKTLVHPMDIDQTNMVTSIANITKVFNEEQKFPEMDAYCISKLYELYIEAGGEADTTELSADNILEVFDDLMAAMDEARVPVNGRILYVTTQVKKILKQADGIVRTIDVGGGENTVERGISRLDEVKIVSVPSTLMMTNYDFTDGWAVASDASQINMLLVHPSSVICPVSYDYAQLDAPAAATDGKYVYFEESFEDVFILNNRIGALQFNVEGKAASVSVSTVAATKTKSSKASAE